jgi:2-oxoglutarate dehydrogenase E2 component (dihydrolipoamide succinyltransferase)
MKVDIIMPKMGESLQEGTIIRWTKNIGEKVERDETILEISTDKVDTEVPSPVDGILSEILAQENETVEVGKVIARISTEGEGSTPAPAKEEVQAKNESVTSSEKTDEKIAVPEQAPAMQAAAANINQTVAPIANATAEVTTAKVQESSKPVPVDNKAYSPTTNGHTNGATYEIPARDNEKFYSPLVREIAKQNHISLEELRTMKGSGTDNRINKDDILAYIASKTQAMPEVKNIPQQSPNVAPTIPAKTQQPANEGEINPIFKAAGEYEVIPMDRIRLLIAEHMVRSKATSPHVTSVAEADVTGIVKLREKMKEEFQSREGFKLTYTPFFALAAIEALVQYPNVNVSVDGNKIIRFKHINLGIATALDDGNLIVPVIKSSEELNITGLARQIYDLANRARTKKLNPDEIQGGTFSITNVGTFGTLFGTPIINQPQTAIMGIGAIEKRPVVREVMGNDMIVIRNMVYVSITYDHRIIDGQLAGKTLAAIVSSLESMNETTIKL